MKKIIKITLIVTLVLLLLLAAVGFVFWPNMFFGGFIVSPSSGSQDFDKFYAHAVDDIRFKPTDLFTKESGLHSPIITRLESNAGKIPSKLNPGAYDWTMYGTIEMDFDISNNPYMLKPKCSFKLDRSASHPSFSRPDEKISYQVTRNTLSEREKEEIATWADKNIALVKLTEYVFVIRNKFTTVELTFEFYLKDGFWEKSEQYLSDEVALFQMHLSKLV